MFRSKVPDRVLNHVKREVKVDIPAAATQLSLHREGEHEGILFTDLQEIRGCFMPDDLRFEGLFALPLPTPFLQEEGKEFVHEIDLDAGQGPFPARRLPLASEDAARHREGERQIEFEEAGARQGLGTEKDKVGGFFHLPDHLLVLRGLQPGHRKMEVHAQKEGKPCLKILDKLLMAQAQALHFLLPEVDGIAEIIRLHARTFLLSEGPSVRPDDAGMPFRRGGRRSRLFLLLPLWAVGVLRRIRLVGFFLRHGHYWIMNSVK